MPFFLIIILALVVAFTLRMRYLDKNHSASIGAEQYLREDYEANFSRAREIDEDMFIRLTERELPFRYDYSSENKTEKMIINIQKKVKLSLEVPIIKTDIPNNIEVKKRFGLANLQVVADGEENHTRLMRNMNTWARLLMELENHKDAEAILSKAVAARSDISETYILLYEIYTKTNRQEKIQELLLRIEALPETTKKLIASAMENIPAQGD